MIRTFLNGVKKVVAIVLVSVLAFIGALALIPSTNVDTSGHEAILIVDGQKEQRVTWTEVDSISADWKYTALDAIKDCVDACVR